jgi:hypothetical protein
MPACFFAGWLYNGKFLANRFGAGGNIKYY